MPKRAVLYVICRNREADRPLYRPRTPSWVRMWTKVPLKVVGALPVRVWRRTFTVERRGELERTGLEEEVVLRTQV
jgi:hypothetical protein